MSDDIDRAVTGLTDALISDQPVLSAKTRDTPGAQRKRDELLEAIARGVLVLLVKLQDARDGLEDGNANVR